MITKEKAISLLNKIATLLQLQNVSPFKVNAFTKAAETLRTLPESQFQAAIFQDIEWADLPNIGKSVHDALVYYTYCGADNTLNNFRGDLPPTLTQLLDLSGLGPKKVQLLWKDHNITSIADLESLINAGQLTSIKGFSTKTEEKLLASIAQWKANLSQFYTADLHPIFQEELNFWANHSVELLCAGAYRRHESTIASLDLILVSDDPHFPETLLKLKPSLKRSENNAYSHFISHKEKQLLVTYTLTTSKRRGNTLHTLTATPEYQEHLHQHLATLNIDPQSLDAHSFETEEALFQHIKLTPIPPECRESESLWAPLNQEQLSKLVTVPDIKGVFHNHTTASDGANSLEEMAQAAAELGLQYLGIADHSRSSIYANGLSIDRLLKQLDAIHNYNNNAHKPIHIFAGIECDILPDGSLDYPDEILAQLDYVVASIHSNFQMDEDTMTERIITAIKNPYITMLGHISGRLLLRRQAYPINYPAIFETAASTNTIIELNCSPKRVDMDWQHWVDARNYGIKCSINTDAHSIKDLQHFTTGVPQARKALLTKREVFNCLDLSSMKAYLTPQNCHQ